MLEIFSLAACGWLLMHNPTEDLRLPITEWEQSLAFDTAAECETFIATRWVKAEKEHDDFKLERYKFVLSAGFYPPTNQKKKPFLIPQTASQKNGRPAAVTSIHRSKTRGFVHFYLNSVAHVGTVT